MPTATQVEAQLHATAAVVDQQLRSLLADRDDAPPRLVEAMRYSVLAGGKRLRPALALWSCEVCSGSSESAWPAAIAVELVHTFSLIHDDLPAIDNDDLRRGRPTCHKAFGEAMAILAGDALLTLAFEVLADGAADDRTARQMTTELAQATGRSGMIGGEVADVEGEEHEPDADLVRRIHTAKTARLIQAACHLGGLSGQASQDDLEALSAYGLHLGLAFQAADDQLDATGSDEAMGKKTGKDAAAGKQTYVRAVGLEASRRIAREAADAATAGLDRFGQRGAKLAALAVYVIQRHC